MEISSSRAHIAAQGQNTALFEEKEKIILKAAPPWSLNGVSKAGWQFIRDCFKKISAERHSANKNNAASSGIIEEVGERETLLDDLFSEIDENEEVKGNERDEKRDAEKKVVQAGAKIREAALQRHARRTVGQEVESVKGTEKNTTLSGKQRKPQQIYGYDEEDKSCSETI